MPLMMRRPLLRAAAVGGGAYAMGRHSANKQAEREDMAYQQGASDTAAAAPPPAPPAGGGGITAEDTNRLAELGRLHEQGILTDEEFAQQKARILGI
jgi:putative oligomerization/nucleic acid binding protein